jgi:hypothetical protein
VTGVEWLLVLAIPLGVLLAPTVVGGLRRTVGRPASVERTTPVAGWQRTPVAARVPVPSVVGTTPTRVSVPAAPTGRPGFTVWLPGPPTGARPPHEEGTDLVREVALGEHGMLQLRVLGPVAAAGTAAERPGREPAGRGRWRGWAPVGPPQEHPLAPGPVVVNGLGHQNGWMITEWHLDRLGWAFLVTVMTRRDHAERERLGAAVVASLSWEVEPDWPADWR